VESFPDGQSALAAVQRQPPDLVLADIMMPNLNGFELLSAVRANEQTQFVPVILLSARAGAEARVEGLQAGADDYVAKPFTARELVGCIDAHLKLARLQKEYRDALSENDRRKDEFLAMLAHELRNPLAPLLTGLHLLRMPGNRRESVEEMYDLMERQIGHLVRLVDDLMEVSRTTRGNIELRKERLELAAVIQSAIEISKPLIVAAHHELNVDLPNAPFFIDADPVRLAQVFSNLLNNSAKYTEKGGRIWLTAYRENGSVLVSVRDNGIGIAAKMLPRVFDLFTQLRGSYLPQEGAEMAA
jgi:signal transduction histidine kinase